MPSSAQARRKSLERNRERHPLPGTVENAKNLLERAFKLAKAKTGGKYDPVLVGAVFQGLVTLKINESPAVPSRQKG